MNQLLEPGNLVYLDYTAPGGGGYGEYHERLVVEHIEGTEFMIATPTFDLYAENISRLNADIYDLRLGVIGGGLPAGLEGANVFGFGVLTQARMDALMNEGRRLARLERAARGIAPPGGPAGAGVGGAAAIGMPAVPGVLGGALVPAVVGNRARPWEIPERLAPRGPRAYQAGNGISGSKAFRGASSARCRWSARRATSRPCRGHRPRQAE